MPSMQGKPIPSNTPIVMVFNKNVNLSSAQQSVAIRSGIETRSPSSSTEERTGTAVHTLHRIIFQRKRAASKTVSPRITSHHAEWHNLI